MAARCHVSGSEEEGIIVICINNGAKPHNLATRQIKTSRGVFNHRSITVQLPSPLPAARLRVGHAHRHLGSVADTRLRLDTEMVIQIEGKSNTDTDGLY